jgi:hypothetical protein
MPDTITIPPEAIEAAAIDLHRLVYDDPDSFSWAETDEGTRTHFRNIARAACRAMLKNWPYQQYHSDSVLAFAGYGPGALILPLPKEPSDDK